MSENSFSHQDESPRQARRVNVGHREFACLEILNDLLHDR